MLYWRRPLTRLEAGTYAALVGVFLVIFARYMLGYMEVAERVAMEATLMNTSAAINIKAAQAFIGQRPAPRDVMQRNPFEVAGATPPNFGELASLASGGWAYDAERGEVVYLPRLRSSLHTSDGQSTLRFRLVRGRAGYAFEPSAPFTWE